MNSEQAGTYSPSIPPLVIRNMRIDSNNRTPGDAISRNFTQSRRTNKERRVNKRATPAPERVSTKNRTSFAEKDFIVFSIKEDGTFDIDKDGSSQTSVCREDDCGLRSLRSVNIEDDEEESTRLEEDNHSGSLRMGFRVEGNGDCSRGSTESSDSGQSDRSTNSFTFPALHGQWIGSPVKMPRSEDLSLRKPTASCVRFKCCKF
ncbi:protein BREAKING OF ASYMMETRY IN THE STOMATAL LINEAGE-like [Rhodamnia argentea]|uniref:Protein BREAKING OF ASYMMETRY IN THE STOMATAL LINEAGE-like n=1 Tax=Rhodamnia argentea TaxID=178133 RepID=A0ABM3HM95_9MYRT|nr:protein BREAKING OF ASYMMETRY IN THE STOMATAL LINEAGE-like [Rhodamnia argentea]